MRVFKFLMFAGLILAVTGTVGAVTFTEAYNGPLVMHVHNYADGTTYTGKITFDAGATYVDTFDPALTGKWANPVTGVYDQVFAPHYAAGKLQVLHNVNNAKIGENGWGIFQVDSIQRGIYDSAGNSVNVDYGNPASLWATGTTELVGAYFDRKDISVQFSTAGSGAGFVYTNQIIEAKGDQYQMWEQKFGQYDPTLGTAGRLYAGGLPIDKYQGVGYNAVGGLLVGADNLLNGISLAGFVGTDPTTEVFADFTPSSVTGKVHVFIELTGGSEYLFWDTGIFYPQKAGFYTYADMRLDVDDKPVSTADWLTYSSDPLQGAFVPEPITMFGCFLGIGALGRYMGKRVRSRN